MTEFIERRILPLVMAFAMGLLVAPDDRDSRADHYRTAHALAECQQSIESPADGVAMQHYAVHVQHNKESSK